MVRYPSSIRFACQDGCVSKVICNRCDKPTYPTWGLITFGAHHQRIEFMSACCINNVRLEHYYEMVVYKGK